MKLPGTNLTFHASLYKDTADEETKRKLKIEYQKKSRDNARTPMQWDASPHAGFTTGNKPWMRVNDNYSSINAAAQTTDPQSVYHCWRQVLRTRKAYKEIFVYGNFELVDEPNDKVFAYKRTADGGEEALVVCNFSTETVKWKGGEKATMVLVSPTGKTLDDVKGGEISLGPCEALAVLL